MFSYVDLTQTKTNKVEIKEINVVCQFCANASVDEITMIGPIPIFR